MITSEYCQVMADYNQWMNQKLYSICIDELGDGERKQDRGAFFGSIHGTLDHIFLGDRLWLGRFLQQPFAGKIGRELYKDFSQLHQARIETDRQIITWTAELTTSWLEQPLTYTSGIDQKVRTMPSWVLVTHFFNHQTHHRGQVTTLLSQLGYDLGTTDLPWLPRFLDK